MSKNYSILPNISDEIFSERFSQIDDFFSKLTGNIPFYNFPNYYIRKIDNDSFEFILCIPGFSKDDINIGIKGNFIFIKGKKSDLDKDYISIYKNIGVKNFSLSFNIGNKSKVKSAKLKYGLLYILLYIEIPEEEKLQKINIQD